MFKHTPLTAEEQAQLEASTAAAQKHILIVEFNNQLNEITNDLLGGINPLVTAILFSEANLIVGNVDAPTPLIDQLSSQRAGFTKAEIAAHIMGYYTQLSELLII